MARNQGYYRDVSRPVATKFRPQRVKFRRRYASSRATALAQRVGTFLKIGIFLGVFGYGSLKAQQFWKTSDWVRVSAVESTGDTTPALIASLGLKPGLNLVTLPVSELEARALSSHKEFETVNLVRHMDRSVSVASRFRTGIASFDGSDGKKGIDASGVVFTRPAESPAIAGPGLQGDPSAAELKTIAAGLLEIKNNFPAFYSRVKFLKTDRILPLRLILDNDVVVVWGEINPSSVAVRIPRIEQVLKKFVPKKAFASLRFVTDDRVVMDAQWSVKK